MLEGHWAVMQRTYASFKRVADYQCRAACVPGFTEGRPAEFLTVREAAIELGAGFGDCGDEYSKFCWNLEMTYIRRDR